MSESVPSPGSFVVYELERRGWSQREFAEIIGRPFQLVNEIIKGKRAITTDTAVAIGAAVGTGAEIWLQREAAYQVSQATVDTEAVTRRARMYDIAPVKEMQKRQWIAPTDTIEDLERELKRFFSVDSFDQEPEIAASMRRSGEDNSRLTPSQRAWCFRVLQLGSSLIAAEYDESRLPDCESELRKVAAYAPEVNKVPRILASYGIRLVIVEPLATCKVDGVVLWRDHNSPIIGLAMRYDRIDNFWFTLCHELSHVKHRDAVHVDADVSGQQMLPMEGKSKIERRADEEAAAMLVKNEELQSFVQRVGPLYSKDKIIRFANRIKMHPGIIVGQLQNRGEMGYSANREMLVKVRDTILPATVVDGWKRTIDPRSL